MAKPHELLIAENCVAEAKRLLGAGWKHVSYDVQWGLISARIINVLLAQDETIDGSKVRDYIVRIVELARELHGQE